MTKPTPQAPRGRPLPAVAARVDTALSRLSVQIDWLRYLSPRHNDQLWSTFRDSGYKSVPELEYHPPEFDPMAVRKKLLALPINAIELPAVEALLVEKQHELDRQLELIRLRNTPGFHSISDELFGSPTAWLLALAQRILHKTPCEQPATDNADCAEVLAAAQQELAFYRAINSDFDAQVCVDADLNSELMVANGQLHIAASIQVPRGRIAALLAHEVGTHVITWFNGRQQPLQQLACGLAHYDPLQEGLGVVAEYLAGQLSAERLRELAARVVAAQLALLDRSIADIYACLHEQHAIPAHPAFDVAVRACRGGGLTKDIVYLRGLHELLDYLRQGGDLNTLHRGKLALRQLPILDALQAQEYVLPPRLLPRHLSDPEAKQRLARLITLPTEEVFQPFEEVP